VDKTNSIGSRRKTGRGTDCTVLVLYTNVPLALAVYRLDLTAHELYRTPHSWTGAATWSTAVPPLAPGRRRRRKTVLFLRSSQSEVRASQVIPPKLLRGIRNPIPPSLLRLNSSSMVLSRSMSLSRCPASTWKVS
jgi:hypothetical protein